MHISEEILEKFYLEPESFSREEKVNIIMHLDSCNECSLLLDSIAEFINEIDVETDEEPTVNDNEFALIIKHRLENVNETNLLIAKNNSVELYNHKAEIISRFSDFSLRNIFTVIKHYPFASFTFAAISVMAVAFIFTTFRTTIKDSNPVYAEIKNSILHLYNKQGDIYLKSLASGIKPIKTDSIIHYSKGIVKTITIADVLDDSKNEILLFGNYGMQGMYATDTLYCLDNYANVKWKSSLAPKVDFNSLKWHLTKWSLVSVDVINYKGSKKIIATANDYVYAASVVMDIDPETGKVLQNFYFPGHLVGIIHYDINNDLQDELIISTINNALRRISLTVLSLDNISGFAPANDYFYPAEYYKGSELYYILLPWTEHGKKHAKANFNALVDLKSAGTDELIVYTWENNGVDEKTESVFGLLFNFDKNFYTKSIIGSVVYVKTYEELYNKGVYTQPLDSVYFNAVRDSIKYWDGDKFVNSPTKNKYWNQKFQMPE
ncbi:MAG: hypothetical protein FD143_828 [Ignavibacteria bacterium]|nr:MAG: hypothetical protein FD143_828 [Ignavibacteria bacterium]KAF0160586.1 MAG: hypothetical protein FD188_1578 [Ignavibacteria bacterium]